MDKYEYKVRAEEIKSLIAEGEFAEAVKIADTIDWRRVKSVMMLCTISDLYKINRRFQESKDILLMAYERHPGGRLIVYSLCELSIKMGETVQAIEYYKEFVQIAPKDTGRYILQYKLYEAQDVSLEERIAVLEEFKKRDYREKWAYELAYLYHRVGLETKCVEECDELVLWFGEGRYVIKALELKMLHQSLSAAQQEKYTQLKQEAERQLMEADEDDTEEEAVEEDIQENISENGDIPAEVPQEEPYPEAVINPEIDKVTEFPGYTGTADTAYAQPEEEEEEEFRVKTVDVGQYNTINLQRALAESMKEILGDDEKQEEETKEDSEAEHSSIGPITQSIIAPLLQETEDIPPLDGVAFGEVKKTEEVQKEEAAPQFQIPKSQTQVSQIPEPQTEREEVFFEEDVKDVLLEDTKEINLTDAVMGNLGDTKELNPKRRIIYPSVSPANVPMQGTPTQSASVQNAPTQNVPMQEEVPETITTEPVLMKVHKPSGFEQMLSQEYDGQISLVVPNRDEVEKQITGQMNIADIMVEWERMKRENEEKRREDVRRRVEQHTGNMFSEFDEAMRNGLLEQLNDIAKNVETTEAGAQKKPEENTREILPTAEEQKADTAEAGVADRMEADVTGSTEAVEPQQPLEEVQENKEEASDDIRAVTGIPAEAAEAVNEAKEASETAPEVTETVEEAAITGETTDMAEKLSQIMGVVQESSSETNKLRPFTEEEKELFGRFAHNKKTKEQIIQAIDIISMDSYSGNVIVTGEEGAGTLELAKSLVRMLQMTDSNFSGKVAKISGETLNKKDIPLTLSKLVDGALIIEHATDMASGTATDLNKALAKENSGLFVVMEGRKDEMNIFLRRNGVLMDNFNAKIDIEALDDQSLVEYARQYAEEMEYSIDELGILALHTRIADMQTSDHEVTVAEVRDLVDDAIYFADKKNPKHFFDLLFGKRYDEEDMIILREKDFMHY